MQAPVQLVRASIDVRASVAEALRRWSEFPSSAPLTAGAAARSSADGGASADGAPSGMVAFQRLNEAESRVTVQLEVGQFACDPANGLVELTRRALDRDLRAFKRFLEAQERPRQEHGSC